MLELIIRAVSVTRGPGSTQRSYVTSLPYADVARLLDDERLYVPNDPDLPDFAQRKPNPVRIKAIAEYILETFESGTTFFPPICVNAQPAPEFDPHSSTVRIPYRSLILRLTDGQHRCYAIRQALEEIKLHRPQAYKAFSELEIGALVYSSLNLEQERQAFRDQNLLAQRPGTSLAYMFDQRSPVVLIAKSLLKEVPCFKDNVETHENGLGKHNPKLLTLSTLVAATQHMFPRLKKNEDLVPLTAWAISFWKSAARHLAESWQPTAPDARNAQRSESLAVSAVVFQALGLIANDLRVEGAPLDNLPQWLSGIKQVDWRRTNPLWQQYGILQPGSNGELIISNTRTTVQSAHRLLQEFVGLVPASSLV
jgi:DGQHR domain-containing protein